MILDGCHNPAGAKALAGVLRTHTKKKPAAVLGVLDKAAAQILEALAPCFDTIYTVTPPCPRAMEAQELAELARTAAPKGNVTACAERIRPWIRHWPIRMAQWCAARCIWRLRPGRSCSSGFPEEERRH